MTEPIGRLAEAQANDAGYGPWNPGLRSDLPFDVLPLSTLFRPENAFNGPDEAHELGAATGLAVDELVVFRPRRLAVHELLVRVTADLSVPDPEGVRVEEFGVIFRRIVQTIQARYVEPRMGELEQAYASIRHAIAQRVDAELDSALATIAAGGAHPRGGRPAGWLGFLHRAPRAQRAQHDDGRWQAEEQIVRAWAVRAQSAAPAVERAACSALVRVASAVRAKHGRLWGDRGLLAPIACGIACNALGAEAIGELLDPLVADAVAREGYRTLPIQAQPVVMNTKGAPASGKTSIRPLQRKLAAELGIQWGDFAIVSPDIWRKYLLDYDSLGPHYKYAGALAARELAIVDQKLDRYMARKADRRRMTHLLIDRFRFDSFAPDSDEAGSNLLTRFGRVVYMFFMITPPHATVERAWRRGLEVGRYKAVDDVLAQNVEAYTGMPELFFTWALWPGIPVHYEFLDNDVSPGTCPRTAAFGWNGELNVLDVKCMLDIDRFRRIRIDATAPSEVYPDARTMAPERNTRFLERCARDLEAVNFADRVSGRIYARIEAGRLAWIDPEIAGAALADPENRVGLLAVAPGADAIDAPRAPGPRILRDVVRADRFHTVGSWNGLGPASTARAR